MKSLSALLVCLLVIVGCSTAPKMQSTKADKTFFDAEVVETFILGKTTQMQIREALGAPYPDPLKTPERWTYMYTYKRQIIFTFDKEVLTGKKWSEEYGIGTQ